MWSYWSLRGCFTSWWLGCHWIWVINRTALALLYRTNNDLSISMTHVHVRFYTGGGGISALQLEYTLKMADRLAVQVENVHFRVCICVYLYMCISVHVWMYISVCLWVLCVNVSCLLRVQIEHMHLGCMCICAYVHVNVNVFMSPVCCVSSIHNHTVH